MSALSVGEAVDNNVHKPRKPRPCWPAGRCPEIVQLIRMLVARHLDHELLPGDAGHVGDKGKSVLVFKNNDAPQHDNAASRRLNLRI
ncbi:hypothetical protein [Polaromonas sp. CG_9.11]|uniref:hypothetical protein n=1 Tax=Polaromonas sp. CG_9.11 TaxID=2787730 RepID=UPI0018C96BE2|nr:hypothetical protein [Polaromonas sp. CG_9.11]MBG6076107.1 hypothetical protein [Polaromonas sp. CG_9.11]